MSSKPRVYRFYYLKLYLHHEAIVSNLTAVGCGNYPQYHFHFRELDELFTILLLMKNVIFLFCI
jgi:hypothetical protein